MNIYEIDRQAKVRRQKLKFKEVVKKELWSVKKIARENINNDKTDNIRKSVNNLESDIKSDFSGKSLKAIRSSIDENTKKNRQVKNIKVSLKRGI